MKVSIIYLAGIVSSAEKKVPPRHPLQRLERLVEFTEEILTSDILQSFLINSNEERSDKWIENWTKRWVGKFATNAGRMERNFSKVNRKRMLLEEHYCGFHDESIEQDRGSSIHRQRREVTLERYDRENPCKGIKQLLTGFSKWSDRYIASCSGQKNRQSQPNRMIKWEGILNKGTD